MQDSTSTLGLQRPRVRRGLGVFVGMALLVTPAAIAPSASASTFSNVTPASITALLSQLLPFLIQILESIENTLANPVGGAAPNSGPCTTPNDGISSTITCSVTGPLGPKSVKATVKAGRVSSVRWVNR